MILDDGYQFGLGAFETIAVYKKKAVLLKEHLERLNNTLNFLGIERVVTEKDLQSYIEREPLEYFALKVLVSDKNLIVTTRDIHYSKDHYSKGFDIEFSKIRRNNTSPLVFHKTFNYGECIMEKRAALKMKIDELLFLNFNEEICEGTTCNIFFVKDNKIYTPKLSCGMLPGIIRSYVCKNYDVTETIIKTSDISEFEECFVTNSLMGIMPVHRLGDKVFEERSVVKRLCVEYFGKVVGCLDVDVE